MGKYSRITPRFDRGHAPRMGATLTTGLFLLFGAACAAHKPKPAPAPAPVAPQPLSAPLSPAPAFLEPTAPATAPGSPIALRPEAPLRYVVQRGDTLWSIANRFLLDPWQWPEVWYVNGQVRNPHLIYPGDVLMLVTGANGQPQITLDVEHVSPQIRSNALEQAIPTIPLDAIRDFLRGPRLVTQEEIKRAPYLLAFVDEHILGGQANLIYVKNLPPSEPYTYAVVRPGKPYVDPDDNAVLGYEAIPVGEAQVKQLGNPATATLAKTDREALVGDRLLPLDAEPFQNDFYPHAPAGPVGGRIIAAFDGVSQISQFQVVAINRGSSQGLEVGHVLQILQTGAVVPDPYGKKKVQLPDQPAGLLLVFKTTPKLSYGLVMNLTRAAHVLDKVEQPQPAP